MKKRTLVVLGLVLSLSMIAAGSAMARQGEGYGKMGAGYERGCGDCYRSDVDPEVLDQFRAETQPLKDELRALRQELRDENRKNDTDAERVSQLREDMEAVRAKIQETAEKYGIDCDGGKRGSKGRKGKRNGDCRGDCS